MDLAAAKECIRAKCVVGGQGTVEDGGGGIVVPMRRGHGGELWVRTGLGEGREEGGRNVTY